MSLAEPIAAGGGVLHGDKYPRRNSRSASASNLCTGATGKTGSPSQYCCASRLGTHSESATGSSRMDDRDKMIYNSLGDTSGPKGKASGAVYFPRACHQFLIPYLYMYTSSCMHPYLYYNFV